MRYAVMFALFVITTSIVQAQTPGSAARGYMERGIDSGTARVLSVHWRLEKKLQKFS